MSVNCINFAGMHIFFEPNLLSDIITLSQEESSHCARVLRLRPGQEIGVTNGIGTFAKATLLDVNPKGTTATILHRQSKLQRSFRLHMVVAPTKSIDRFEWFLEKATECGVEEITPLICEHSERTVIKPERLQKILLAAMKQSQRVYLPVLNPAVKFREFVKQIPEEELVYMAHCAEGEKASLQEIYPAGTNAIIMIGPEGDFSQVEIEQAQARGSLAISLGEYRLRTETAALVACMGVNFKNREIG